ncbi:MAG: 50S ribosomal protein L30 [Desulfovibrio sp.]|nr:50S ribosomal protein L30 [Desulfovibrio sp.]
MIKIELIRSRIGALPKQRRVLDALGLRRMHSVREFQDTAAIRGMIAKVVHMVKVVRHEA